MQVPGRALGSWMHGGDLPIKFDQPDIVRIPGKQYSWGVHTYTNGIMTSREEALAAGYMQHKSSGGYETYVHRIPSQGFVSDILRCGFEFSWYPNTRHQNVQTVYR